MLTPSSANHCGLARGTGLSGVGLQLGIVSPDARQAYREVIAKLVANGVEAVTEDNIPDETKRARSDEFWSGVLSTSRGSLRPRLKD